MIGGGAVTVRVRQSEHRKLPGVHSANFLSASGISALHWQHMLGNKT